MSSTANEPRLLVIESNVLFARRLGDALKREGFDVVHSTGSAFALTMVEYDPPAAILCATNLREMGALELPRILRNDPKTAQIPVIALGDAGDQALMAAFRAGCDDYVDRGIGAENIAAHVRVFLRSRREGFQPTQMLESSETALQGTLTHLDLPGIIQMLEQSRQNGALHINAGQTDALIFFQGGEVVHAECGDLAGDDAVIHIVKSCNGVEQGVYKFVPGDTAPTRTVQRSATELMLDALRAFDEGRAVNEGGFE